MNRKILGDKAFYKDVLRLGMPIAIQNLLQSSLSMIDTVMIGSLGEVPLSAVGMAGQWSMLMFYFFFGLSAGGAVFFAQYWGSGDLHGIRRTYGMALSNMVLVSLVFAMIGFAAPSRVIGLFTGDAAVCAEGARYLRIAVWGYAAQAIGFIAATLLRSTEEVRLPLFASLASVLSNTLLNWILIFGKFGMPAMGVEGAALATVISAWINTGILLLASWAKKNDLVCTPLKELFSFDWAALKKFYIIAIPVVLNEALWGLATIVQNMVFGRLGTGNYSALTIERTISGLLFVFFGGLGSACTVMVGKKIGAGDLEGGNLDARRFGVVAPALAAVMSLLLVCFRGILVDCFSLSDAVRHTASSLLLVVAAVYPLRIFNYITIVGIFRAGGDTRTGMYYDLATIWLVSTPLVALTGFVLHWNFVAVYAMMYAEDLVKVFLGQRHLLSKKWIRPVTGAGQDTP